jgi:hypothetical protein
LYGFHPTIELHAEDNVLEGEVPAPTGRVKRIQEEWKVLEKRWREAVDTKKKHYDKKHIAKDRDVPRSRDAHALLAVVVNPDHSELVTGQPLVLDPVALFIIGGQHL